MNLNWRELPEGEVNLITRGSYSISEAQNVLNMHLLTRGFTLLERDEVLFLVKLDDSVNPTMVPRVTAEQLDERGNYEYVRVSLSLDWMLAEDAARELAPILSPYGKIVPLTATNRIEATDAVVNLRELRDLLKREQSDGGQDRLVAEFPLRHADATEVIEKLKTLLGIEAQPTRMSRDQIRLARDEMVLQTEMIKRLGDRAPKMDKKEVEVHLVANERQNSILANAAPDKIAVIRQAVQALDTPTDDHAFRLSDVTTMKVYPMNGADADSVAEILKDLQGIGKLDRNTRFTQDEDRQTIFAHASLEDHLTIKSVMDQMSGSARDFQVITLERLQAEYVAESIRAMMLGESATNTRNRGRSRRTPQSSGNGFRIEADIPGNRIFLHATAAESKQVDELLVQLGERKAVAGNERVLSVSAENLEETIERVRDLWPTLSNQPLHLDVPDQRPRRSESPTGDRSRRIPVESDEEVGTDLRSPRRVFPPSAPTRPSQDPTAFNTFPGNPSERSEPELAKVDEFTHATREVSLVRVLGPERGRWDDSDRFGVSNSADSSPVTVRGENEGKLILRSDDRQALSRLESELEDLVRGSGFSGSLPQAKPYTVFKLDHASPYLIEMTLQDIFASDGVRLAKPLRFVSDSTTRSLMVFGAGEAELREIEELLDFYDRPQDRDPETLRKPQYFELQYAKAEEVAEVIKDLYRDLLSTNDRALAEQQQGRRSQQTRPTSMPIVNSNEKELQFKGMLSVGVYADTNTLIVSAPQYLTEEIRETIQELDQEEAGEAAGTVTSVIGIGGDVNGSLIAERLGAMMEEQSGSRDRRDLRQDPRRSRYEGDRRPTYRGGPEDFRRFRGQPSQRPPVRRTGP